MDSRVFRHGDPFCFFLADNACDSTHFSPRGGKQAKHGSASQRRVASPGEPPNDPRRVGIAQQGALQRPATARLAVPTAPRPAPPLPGSDRKGR